MREPRWARCIRHRGEDVRPFLKAYFESPTGRPLVISGAGFDPRTGIIPELIHSHVGSEANYLLIEEARPNPDPVLQQLAADNRGALRGRVPYELLNVTVVGEDGAVIAGRQAVQRMRAALQGEHFGDVFVDFSALSVGISFTLVQYFLGLRDQGVVQNVHVVVASAPSIDHGIKREHSATPTPIHGFKYKFGAEAERHRVHLWVPLLRPSMTEVLAELQRAVGPDEVVPVLPFPSRNPRLGDQLLVEYREMFESDWDVEPRELLYAAEDDPLDIYRLLLRVYDLRGEVFAALGGSEVVLSPTGSKRMAIGMMMAAIDRKMPIVYLETLGYRGDAKLLKQPPQGDVELMHIWLAGDAYGTPE